ncbi:hypothetical protein GQ457_08G002430 [Hibiscus cannabinus]
MAMRKVYSEIKGMKLKELPSYFKPMLSVGYVKKAVQRGLDNYHAKYIETDSIEPLYHVSSSSRAQATRRATRPSLIPSSLKMARIRLRIDLTIVISFIFLLIPKLSIISQYSLVWVSSFWNVLQLVQCRNIDLSCAKGFTQSLKIGGCAIKRLPKIACMFYCQFQWHLETIHVKTIWFTTCSDILDDLIDLLRCFRSCQQRSMQSLVTLIA